MGAQEVQRPQMLIAGSTGAFPRVAATRITDELKSGIARSGQCSLFLTGGPEAERVYRELAKPQTSKKIDWSKVVFFFIDERCVAPDHPRSNYRMAFETMLESLAIPSERIHRIRAEEADVDAEANRYAEAIPAAIDLMLLGLGAEGHTASLFPGAAVIDEQHRLVVPVRVPSSPARRITLTPPAIRRARLRIVLASGVDKAGIVARAIRGPFTPGRIPVQLALPGLWILDADSASELRIGTDRGVL
jgi:6-phosphogluconolactonase